MQTVNFQCDHCGKLMAVGANYLGQQVRCPHCQHVVLAPAVPPAPIPPALEPAPPVFMDPDITFKMPPPEPTFLPPPAPLLPELPVPEPSAPIPEETAPLAPMPVPAPEVETPAPVTEEPAPFQPFADDAIPGLPNDSFSTSSTTPITRPARQARSSGALWFLLLPLASYAILATILLIILAIKLNNTTTPTLLDKIPDLDGDNPGVKKRGELHHWQGNDKLTRLPLPSSLRTPLGQTLTVGALEVTPTKVVQTKVAYYDEKAPNKPWPCEYDSLVLHLRLRNTASDYAFTPLDNYFDRKYHPSTGDVKPFTQLEIGERVFYGGPAEWYSRNRKGDNHTDRQWLKGRKDFDEEGLGPGQTMKTFVCTDGNDANVVVAAAEFQGAFLWRVHLRRGLVNVKGKDVSATAVVGVQFTRQDIDKVAE
jgi:DNA-directed RNA polymerase subunit RPC12/RpoP